MPGLSKWAIRRPIVALIAWVIVLGAIVGLGSQLGGELNDSFSLPETESTVAQELLTTGGDSAASAGAGARVVWSPANGSAVDAGVLSEITPVLQELAGLASVSCITMPTGASLGSDCPAAPAGMDPDQLQQLPVEQQQLIGDAAGASVAAAEAIATAKSDIAVLTALVQGEPVTRRATTADRRCGGGFRGGIVRGQS